MPQSNDVTQRSDYIEYITDTYRAVNGTHPPFMLLADTSDEELALLADDLVAQSLAVHTEDCEDVYSIAGFDDGESPDSDIDIIGMMSFQPGLSDNRATRVL